MFGKVKINSPRRPNVSMVYTAGQAKAQLTNPNPKETRRAFLVLKPASTKIVEE